MIQLYQKVIQLAVLKLFLDHPYSRFYLRESARLLKMDPMTVSRALDLLVSDDLLVRTKEKTMILYKANLENPACRYLKISYNLAWIQKKGVVRFLQDRMKAVSSVVVFGSYAKGDNDEDSDIDILVISLSKEKPTVDLSRLLKRDVNLVSMSPAEWSQQAKTNRAFYLDVMLDGIVLHGTRPVVE
jgi:uncharacterized protein